MKTRHRHGIRILLSEDHASTRLGIKQILKDGLRQVAFGEVSSAQETLEKVREEAWDLLILDISLSDRSGLEILPEILRLRPWLPVLIFSAHPEDQFAVPALRARAAGYLTKERAPEELMAWVQRILREHPSLSGGEAELPSSPPGSGGLSARELEVLRLTAKGTPAKAIAYQLGVSPKTVSTYRARLRSKLRVGTVGELIRYAVQQGGM